MNYFFSLLVAFIFMAFINLKGQPFINYSKLSKLLLKEISIEKPEILQKTDNIAEDIGHHTPNIGKKSKSFVEEKNGKRIYNVVIYGDNLKELQDKGIGVSLIDNKYLTARLSADEILELTGLNNVIFIENSLSVERYNDHARYYTGAEAVHKGYINNTQFEGEGVIVCVIDTGIDFTHEDFRDPQDPTKSRIIAIWDQTLTKQGQEKTPLDRDPNMTGLNYGVEYIKTEIEDEIDGTPAGFVRTTDTEGHGSHVAGTAAGNGASQASRRHKGIAPKADILVVKTNFQINGIIDGLAYALKKAQSLNKKLVANLSLGTQYHAHNGNFVFDIAIDDFSNNGGIASVSAGNAGGDNIHFSGSFNAGDTYDVSFSIPTYAPNSGANNDYVEIDMYFLTNDNVNVTIISPSGFSYTRSSGETGGTNTNDGYIYVENISSLSHTPNVRNVYFLVYDNNLLYPPKNGNWTIRFSGSTMPMTFHGWLTAYRLGASGAKPVITGSNNLYSIGSPGTAYSAITVGAYSTKWYWTNAGGSSYSYGSPVEADQLAFFSSRGPTVDGRIKPEIAAPGFGVASSRSKDYSPDAAYLMPGNKHVMMEGTSMSAPVVTGTIALMLQANPNLNYYQVKSIIQTTALVDAFTGSVPNNNFGFGKLSSFNSVAKAYNNSFVGNQTLMYNDLWNSPATLTLTSAQRLAVKFDNIGTTLSVVGAFVYFGPTQPSSGNIIGAIYNEAGSSPGTKIGDSVQITFSSLNLNAWNYFDFSNQDISLNSGQNYYFVIRHTAASACTLRANGNNTNPKTYRHDGTNWVLMAGDARVRLLLAASKTLLPVELKNFEAKIIDDKIKLEWITLSETNNKGFVIERKVEGENEYKYLGFVDGRGNSSMENRYSFVDKNVISAKVKYRLKQIDYDGFIKIAGETEIDMSHKKFVFELEQNYPNPFNPVTVISFNVPALQNQERTSTKLIIYDALGREVKTLLNENLIPGRYEITFDASGLSSGVYFYKIICGEMIKVRKAILTK